MRIAHPNIFLKRDFVPVFIQESVLKDVERLDFLDVYLFVILPSPLSCDGEKSFCEVSEDERMHLYCDLFLVLVEEQVLEAAFNLVDVH